MSKKILNRRKENDIIIALVSGESFLRSEIMAQQRHFLLFFHCVPWSRGGPEGQNYENTYTIVQAQRSRS